MKKHFNRFLLLYFVYLLFYFTICLSVIYTVNYFYVFPVICYIKKTSQCKISIVPEEGWFGQPKYRSDRGRKAMCPCLKQDLMALIAQKHNNGLAILPNMVRLKQGSRRKLKSFFKDFSRTF